MPATEAGAVDSFRSELIRGLGKGRRYVPDPDLHGALVRCEQAEVQLDMWEDSTKAQRQFQEMVRRISVSTVAIKTDIEEAELHRFVGLLYEHYQAALSLAASEQAARLAAHGAKGLEKTLEILRDQWEERDLSAELRELRLVRASLLMRGEEVEDSRRLTRPTRLALSRLHKDSWMATRLGDRLIVDVLGHLASTQDLEDVLRNLDLIDREAMREDIVRVLWMGRRGDREIVTLFRGLFEAEVLSVHELPDEISEMLARERKVAWCREKPTEFAAALEVLKDPDLYREHLIVAFTALPRVLKDSDGGEAERWADLIRRHRTEDEENPGRAVLFDVVLAHLEQHNLATSLVGLFTSSGEAVREQVSHVLAAMDGLALPLLLRVLTETDRTAVCVDAAKQIEQLASCDWVVETLGNKKIRPRAAVYLIKILANNGSMHHAMALKGFLRHGDRDVRDASIEAAFSLGHEKAMPVLLRAMYDPDPIIVCRSIHFLERLEHREKKYLRHLIKLVGVGEQAAGRRPPQAVRLAAIETLSRIGNFEFDETDSLEYTLLQLLPEPLKWSLARWRRPEPTEAWEIRAAACDALARVGGKLAIARLKDSSGEPDERVRSRMARAVDDIQRRGKRAG